MKITFDFPYSAEDGNVATLLKETLNSYNIPYTYSMSKPDEEYFNIQREKLIKPIIVDNVAVKVLNEYNELHKVFDNIKITQDIIIELKSEGAFGTGTHPSTQLCLKALQSLVDQDTSLLDVGCGTGVLSIAALKLGANQATGVDLSYPAVKCATENAKRNNVTDKFTAVYGDLVERVSNKYNLVVANLLPDIIRTLLPQLENYLTDDGKIIVSGIMKFRAEEVETYAKRYFDIEKVLTQDNWCCYILKKK